MRVLGFSKKWPKLNQEVFTTFRFSRRDKRDWEVGEVVQIVFKPRSKEREVLGFAKIVAKEPRWVGWLGTKETVNIPSILEKEVKEDGFADTLAFWVWIIDTYGRIRPFQEPMNKLTAFFENRRKSFEQAR